MLGARIIAAQLDRVPGARVAMRFYRGDDAENGRRWASFCDDLERYGSADVAAICATANATFDAYAAWLQTDVNGTPPVTVPPVPRDVRITNNEKPGSISIAEPSAS